MTQLNLLQQHSWPAKHKQPKKSVWAKKTTWAEKLHCPNKFNFTDKFLLTTLAVLLFLLVIQSVLFMFGFNQVHAAEPTTENGAKTVSYGQLNKNFSTESRAQFAKESRTIAITDQTLGKSSGKSRSEMQAEKALNFARTNTKSSTSKLASKGYFHEFAIYDASSFLFDDLDQDGYYQTFSVVFDADVISSNPFEVAYVYAELYLSQDGGPWTHYFSTDVFEIIGENIDDEYEVMTTLYEGYYSDEYDVLIDLYEADYPGIVATFSSDDSDSLYALPLESDDYDHDYEDDYDDDHHHGGSISFGLLLALFGFALSRAKYHR
ncbi:choice-of-anchor H family protein [Thalassotalea sp. ND16A]|uniref:choice-of-anchor H family protein n=1 Tax=Thalassotalea sp. ND16A TaxID=1535422 RepID=UPI000A613084|nr:choice-of-anchor H family protein [Thalassotalea sp. ND16A]